MHDFEKNISDTNMEQLFVEFLVHLHGEYNTSLALSKHHYCKALLESFAIINCK